MCLRYLYIFEVCGLLGLFIEVLLHKGLAFLSFILECVHCDLLEVICILGLHFDDKFGM